MTPERFDVEPAVDTDISPQPYKIDCIFFLCTFSLTILLDFRFSPEGDQFYPHDHQ